MVKTLFSSLLLLCLFSLFNPLFAAPTTEQESPYFAPGPGLPTLASLNLTYADLVAMPTPAWAVEAGLKKRALNCQSAQWQCWLDDAVICYNFLSTLDTYPCTIGEGIGSSAQFCYSNSCRVGGINWSINTRVVSSYWYVVLM